MFKLVNMSAGMIKLAKKNMLKKPVNHANLVCGYLSGNIWTFATKTNKSTIQPVYDEEKDYIYG